MNTPQYNPPWWFEEKNPRKFNLLVSASTGLEHTIHGINQTLKAYSSTLQEIEEGYASASLSINGAQAWQLWQQLRADKKNTYCDLFINPANTPAIKLLICDMDSTIIEGESLDDLAEAVGIGQQIAAITERAMRGEMDFRQALDQRIARLAGIDTTIFQQLNQKIRYTPGAKHLLDTTKNMGIKRILVSGGFREIVGHVAKELDFDDYLSNQLEVQGGKLTGKIIEPIIDAQAKQQCLVEQCKQLAIQPQQACTIGDGANDLPMLQTAGLGIGYKAKPLVQQSIINQIQHSGIDCALRLFE